MLQPVHIALYDRMYDVASDHVEDPEIASMIINLWNACMLGLAHDARSKA